MNDNDKDLISAYLDGETNASESAQVEALLDSDSEAFEYSNQLKQSNIEINDFFKGESMDSLEQSVDNFIAEQSASNSNLGSALPSFNFGSLSAGIASILSPPRAVGAMAAFAIVGVLVLPMIFQNEFDDPNIETYTIPWERSDASQNSIEEILTKNLYDMSSKKILISKTVVLDEQANKMEIFLKLENLPQDTDQVCVGGFAMRDDVKRIFKFCPNSSDKALTFE